MRIPDFIGRKLEGTGTRRLRIFRRIFHWMGSFGTLAGLISLTLFLQGSVSRGSGRKTLPSLKIKMVQMEAAVGQFNESLGKLIEAYRRASQEGVDILVTPEAVFPGYPAWDMLDRDDFIERADQAVAYLQKMTKGSRTALLLGHITFNPENGGRRLINVASLFENGQLVFRQVKTLLPTYDVFDDARYFESGKSTKILRFRGFRLGILICEDWWYWDQQKGRLIYPRDPAQSFMGKVDVAISLSVSPFYRGKHRIRESVHGSRAKDLGVPLIYVGTVGGVDEVQMDGGSFVLNSLGRMVSRLDFFNPDESLVEMQKKGGTSDLEPWVRPLVLDQRSRRPHLLSQEDEVRDEDDELVFKALQQGLLSYMKRTGQSKVVFGLSGGLDSSVVAALTVLTLGPENVHVILMPSEFSSKGSIEDALLAAHRLGIPKANVWQLPIDEVYQATLASLRAEFLRKGLDIETDPLVAKNFVAFENIQARHRKTFELFISNLFPQMIKVATSNKSELAMGYGTMYGDISGALALIGDLYKTEVFGLARYLNKRFHRQLVPWKVIDKEPSAELRPNQITSHELPPYDLLDPLLKDLIEGDLSQSALKEKHKGLEETHYGSFWLDRVLRTFQAAEWKRGQAPFVIKVSPKAFGMGRRVPISGAPFQDVQDPFFCSEVMNDPSTL